MRIYERSELLIHTVPLGTSGLRYRQFWVLNYRQNGYPERVLELVLVGKEAYPLKNSLLPVRIPRIKGMGNRELGVLLDEEVGKNEAYLARVGRLIAKQFTAYLRDEPLPYGPKKNDGCVWIRVRSKYAFLADFLGPPDDEGEDDAKPP